MRRLTLYILACALNATVLVAQLTSIAGIGLLVLALLRLSRFEGLAMLERLRRPARVRFVLMLMLAVALAAAAAVSRAAMAIVGAAFVATGLSGLAVLVRAWSAIWRASGQPARAHRLGSWARSLNALAVLFLVVTSIASLTNPQGQATLILSPRHRVLALFAIAGGLCMLLIAVSILIVTVHVWRLSARLAWLCDQRRVGSAGA